MTSSAGFWALNVFTEVKQTGNLHVCGHLATVVQMAGYTLCWMLETSRKASYTQEVTKFDSVTGHSAVGIRICKPQPIAWNE